MPDPASTVTIEQAHPDLHVDERVLRRLIRHIVAGETSTLGTLNVVLTGHDTVLALNRQYLGHDYTTDVLSFDLSDTPDCIDGEVYVDLDTAMQRHDEFEASFEEEVFRYVVHGVLHLVGYSDETSAEKALMRRLEDRYLSAVR